MCTTCTDANQALPFIMDSWNTTGQYRSMVDSCEDAEGVPRCFYRVSFLSRLFVATFLFVEVMHK
jgi:hypothetical protein